MFHFDFKLYGEYQLISTLFHYVFSLLPEIGWRRYYIQDIKEYCSFWLPLFSSHI